jgi:hypothetical protein
VCWHSSTKLHECTQLLCTCTAAACSGGECKYGLLPFNELLDKDSLPCLPGFSLDRTPSVSVSASGVKKRFVRLVPRGRGRANPQTLAARLLLPLSSLRRRRRRPPGKAPCGAGGGGHAHTRARGRRRAGAMCWRRCPSVDLVPVAAALLPGGGGAG